MSETHGGRQMLRRVGAFFAGFAAIVILSIGTDVALHAAGIYPPWDKRMSDGLFVLATFYRLVYNVAGCYLTARLAPDRPMWHALALGVVGLVLSIVGSFVASALGPAWYGYALVITALPCAWAGGKIREMQLRAPAGN